MKTSAATVASLLLLVCPAGAESPGAVASDAVAEPPAWLPENARAGVENEALVRLLEDHWAWTLETNPVFATRVGVRRFDDRLGDESHAAVLAVRDRLRPYAEEGRRILAEESLSPADTNTARVFVSAIEEQLATEICEFQKWSIDPHLGNVLNDVNQIPDFHVIESEADAANLLHRYRETPAQIGHRIENLARGLLEGYAANANAVRLTVEQIDAALAQPIEASPLLAPGDPPHPEWPPGSRERFASALREAVRDEVRPALRRYADFLRDVVLPRARGPENEGIAGIPDGATCYEALIRMRTTLPDATAAALHEKGLEEIARINREMVELGRALFGTDDLSEILRRLREDPAMHFSEPDEIVASAEAALAAATEAMPRFFGSLPQAPVEVRQIPSYRAASTPAAYYMVPAPDGSRPGRFYVNTFAPETRSRFGMPALTYHESIPGHHLQLALSQEAGDVPAFRRYGISTAFSEGWGLYAERLAGEMGLYDDALSRMGQQNLEAWRAARLVVDTGLHAQGWTRERAVTFMLEHTALARNDIEAEVGRYIANPGQALAYKAGQLEILRLRAEAQDRLGDAFDLRAFHDAVLLGGALPLPVLRDRVDAWIEATAASPAATP